MPIQWNWASGWKSACTSGKNCRKVSSSVFPWLSLRLRFSFSLAWVQDRWLKAQAARSKQRRRDRDSSQATCLVHPYSSYPGRLRFDLLFGTSLGHTRKWDPKLAWEWWHRLGIWKCLAWRQASLRRISHTQGLGSHSSSSTSTSATVPVWWSQRARQSRMCWPPILQTSWLFP